MGLEALSKVMEAHIVADFALCQSTWEILNFVGQLVPLAVILFSRSRRRSLDGVTLNDERIKVDHLKMIMECLQYGLTRDTWIESCAEVMSVKKIVSRKQLTSHCREDRSFRHLTIFVSFVEWNALMEVIEIFGCDNLDKSLE